MVENCPEFDTTRSPHVFRFAVLNFCIFTGQACLFCKLCIKMVRNSATVTLKVQTHKMFWEYLFQISNVLNLKDAASQRI